MHKPFTYLVFTYAPTYLPIYETYFLQNWLLRWNQILTRMRFIHNWVIIGIQRMVCWWVLVHGGQTSVACEKEPIEQLGKRNGWSSFQ
jgi:hypothetical protein